MALKFKFFNSKNHDREYEAADWAGYFAKFISNGVFADPATCLQVVADSGLTVNVSNGDGWINGYMASITAPEAITLASADTVNPRIDRVVLRVDFLLRKMLVTAITGTAAATPTAPDLVRTLSYYDIGLATVAIAANATAITQADITDTRTDSDVCGIVTGLIDQIDVTGLFAQYNAAFNDWFANLHSELDTNQLTHLQNQINALAAKITVLEGEVKLTDDTTSKVYKLGIDNAILYSEEVEDNSNV